MRACVCHHDNARKLFWKKALFWTGCPVVPWVSAEFGFCSENDRKSLGFSGRALELERCQGHVSHVPKIETSAVQDSKRLALFLQGKAKAGGEVWNEDIRKQSFQMLRFVSAKVLTTTLQFCDHSVLMSQPSAVDHRNQEQAAFRARKKAAADLDIDEAWMKAWGVLMMRVADAQ